MFTHYLLKNPLYQNERNLKFNNLINPIVKFNPWYFFFSIFWLIKNKLWGIIPVWFLLSVFSTNLYSYLIDNPPMSYKHPSFLILITSIAACPHFIFSFFVDKILLEKNKNMIWKYRGNEEKQIKKITNFSTLWFSLITALIFITVVNLAIKITPNELSYDISSSGNERIHKIYKD